jgi:hypothetical protein
MYKSVLSKLKLKILTDTDSCLVNTNDEEVKDLYLEKEYVDSDDPILDKFGEFHIGGKFGHFENEFGNSKCNVIYSVAPKFYMCSYEGDDIPIKDRVNKVRCKGVGSKDKRINISLEQYKDIGQEDRLNLYRSLPNALTTDMYQDMIDNKEVSVMCFRMGRVLRDEKEDKGFTIHQEYTYKILQ